MLQATTTPPIMPACPADGAMLLPTALAAMPTMDNHPTFPQGVIHLDNIELVPLHPTLPDNFASLVAASAATSDGALLCGQTEGQQVMSHSNQDQADTLVQKAAAVAVDSIVQDLVADALSYDDMATACAVDAVVNQLVSEAICDAKAACCDTHQRREEAKAVDCVLAQLVSDAVAHDEAAQLEVVDTVLDELVSIAVVDAEAAQANLVSDLNRQSRAVDTVFEQLISDVITEVEAESAGTHQLLPVRSHVSEPDGSVSKEPSMQSTAGTHQVVGSHPSYSQPEDAVSSGAAVRQQLRREMELLNKNVPIETYQVPPIPLSHLHS